MFVDANDLSNMLSLIMYLFFIGCFISGNVDKSYVEQRCYQNGGRKTANEKHCHAIAFVVSYFIS